MAEPDDVVPMFVPLMSLNRELCTAGNYHAADDLLAGELGAVIRGLFGAALWSARRS